jgi:hypothetical protein
MTVTTVLLGRFWWQFLAGAIVNNLTLKVSLLSTTILGSRAFPAPSRNASS